MFPTTVWTDIRRAGAMDGAAMEQFARLYRPAVLTYIERRGFQHNLAEDLCQEVFIRLLRNDLLTRADPDRGRFRTLLRTVAMRVVTDYLRKKKEQATDGIDRIEARPGDDAFDQAWAVHLIERAMNRLRDEQSPYYTVLVEYLTDQHPDRNRLWHARKRLAAYVRHEIAMTCSEKADFEAELAHLSRYLQRGESSAES